MNFSIKTKIMIILLVGCVSVTVVGIIGLFGMKSADDGIETLYKTNMSNVMQIDKIMGLMKDNRIQLLLSLQHDPANPETVKLHDHALAQHLNAVEKNLEEIDAIWKEYVSKPASAEEKKMADDFAEKRGKFFNEGLKPVRDAILAGQYHEATDITITKLNPLCKAANESVQRMLELEKHQAQKAHNDAESHFHTTMALVLCAIIFSVLLSLILGLTVIRSVSSAANALILASDAMAHGDLTRRVGLTSRDELGTIGHSFDAMAESFSTIVSTIALTAADLTYSAAHVHNNSAEMAKGADNVASQAGTVATAGEEMAATSGDIARNCQMAADGARLVSDEAMKGSSIIQASIQVMGHISERVSATAATVDTLGKRSDQIGQIIGTIEDIADQTNLLALNAAIEAARAGEQGRGFAVVADEVRALAERTTKATREIGEMIKAIQTETKHAVSAMKEGVTEVERGTQEAGRSGEAMHTILEQINSLSMQVNQIATAAEEQTATTSEISKNILQITEVSNQTSTSAHNSTAEGNKLNMLADSLTSVLAGLTIDESLSLCLRKAKSAHMIFTGKIMSHLDGSQRLDPNNLPTHLTCAFGKWYQNKGQEKCGNVAIFREISEPHSKVHELGKQAISAYNAGDKSAAAKHCQEMVSHSQNLMAMLDQLEKQCG